MSRKQVESVVVASSNWLWFAVSASILVLFIYFSHPARALLWVTLCVIAGLYLVETPLQHLVELCPQLFGVSTLATTCVYCLSRIEQSELSVQIPTLFWLTGCVSFLVTLTLSEKDRLLCLNLVYLLWFGTSYVFAWPWFNFLPGFTCTLLFNAYWICVFMISIANLMEREFARRKTSLNS
jgi:hypothetical protein